MSIAGVRDSRLAGPFLTVYRRARMLVIGRTPWFVMYGAYRLVRRMPRVYFLMRAVIMNELDGRAK